jgi:hypothetical protein
MITMSSTNSSIPQLIYGDDVILSKIENGFGNVLGIIVDNFGKRKGIFVYKKVDIHDDLYVPYKFSL